MVEYAPAAIEQLFYDIQDGIPAALMGGILGDQAHTYGYHRGRNYVSSSDYSNQLAEDKQGDGDAASALDLSWSKAQPQYDVSRRLLNAKNDERVTRVLRSFFGSVDGVNVCGWDYQGGYAVTSDDSHLWHVHLSILRKYATDGDALAPVADVITGKETDDMNQQETADLISKAINSLFYGGDHGPFTRDNYAWVHDPDDGVADRLGALEKIDHNAKISQAINALYRGGDYGPFTQQAYDWVRDANNGVNDRLTRLEND